MLPERLGDLGGGLHLESGIEGFAAFCRGEHPAGTVDGVAPAGLGAEASNGGRSVPPAVDRDGTRGRQVGPGPGCEAPERERASGGEGNESDDS